MTTFRSSMAVTAHGGMPASSSCFLAVLYQVDHAHDDDPARPQDRLPPNPGTAEMLDGLARYLTARPARRPAPMTSERRWRLEH